MVSLVKNERLKTGWQLDPRFSIELHIKDLNLLKQIKAYFEVGTIYVRTNRNSAIYYVISKDLINVIIPHFSKFPLQTQKQADFLLFKEIVELINQKQHLNIKGLENILRVKASMNTGLSEQLKTRLFELNLHPPIERPFVIHPKNLEPDWLTGFMDGEACFHAGVYKSTSTRSGERITLEFIVGQHSRDTKLIMSKTAGGRLGFSRLAAPETLIDSFNCGRIKISTCPPVVNFLVSRFSDITSKIIPFFNKYPLQGAKALDFSDFCAIAKLMETKAHLTPEGLNRIKEICSGMNSKRLYLEPLS